MDSQIALVFSSALLAPCTCWWCRLSVIEKNFVCVFFHTGIGVTRLIDCRDIFALRLPTCDVLSSLIMLQPCAHTFARVCDMSVCCHSDLDQIAPSSAQSALHCACWEHDKKKPDTFGDLTRHWSCCFSFLDCVLCSSVSATLILVVEHTVRPMATDRTRDPAAATVDRDLPKSSCGC